MLKCFAFIILCSYSYSSEVCKFQLKVHDKQKVIDLSRKLSDVYTEFKNNFRHLNAEQRLLKSKQVVEVLSEGYIELGIPHDVVINSFGETYLELKNPLKEPLGEIGKVLEIKNQLGIKTIIVNPREHASKGSLGYFARSIKEISVDPVIAFKMGLGLSPSTIYHELWHGLFNKLRVNGQEHLFNRIQFSAKSLGMPLHGSKFYRYYINIEEVYTFAFDITHILRRILLNLEMEDPYQVVLKQTLMNKMRDHQSIFKIFNQLLDNLKNTVSKISYEQLEAGEDGIILVKRSMNNVAFYFPDYSLSQESFPVFKKELQSYVDALSASINKNQQEYEKLLEIDLDDKEDVWKAIDISNRLKWTMFFDGFQGS